MKRSIAAIAVLAMIIAFGISADASDRTRQITGKVSSIDGNAVTVTKKNMEVTLNMGEKTKVSECNAGASMGNIKVGDKVTASYKEKDDSNAATSIIVTKK